MHRRGLNFVNDSAVDSMNQDEITNVQGEVDNVAPKIVALLGLNANSDINKLRREMTNYCIQYS